jgi:hypothetical protein
MRFHETGGIVSHVQQSHSEKAHSISDGEKDAAARRERCRAACPAALGATRPCDLPLCFVSVALITAKMVSPSRSAARRVLRIKETA